jgi:hypothetical protein
MCNGAVVSAFVDVCLRTVLARTVATHYGNARLGFMCLFAQDVGYSLHDFVATYRAQHAFERVGLNTRLGKVATTGLATSATVGSRKGFFYLVYSGVFVDLEALRNDVEYQCGYGAYDSE